MDSYASSTPLQIGEEDRGRCCLRTTREGAGDEGGARRPAGGCIRGDTLPPGRCRRRWAPRCCTQSPRGSWTVPSPWRPAIAKVLAADGRVRGTTPAAATLPASAGGGAAPGTLPTFRKIIMYNSSTCYSSNRLRITLSLSVYGKG